MAEEGLQQPQWYVLSTLFGYENIVKRNLMQMVETNGLQDYIFDVVVPEEEEVVERDNGKKKFVMRKKFPNYVFIKMQRLRRQAFAHVGGGSQARAAGRSQV